MEGQNRQKQRTGQGSQQALQENWLANNQTLGTRFEEKGLPIRFQIDRLGLGVSQKTGIAPD